MPQLIASAGGVEIRHFNLRLGKTSLGRRHYNDIVFDNLVVSGEHCVFELTSAGDTWLEDLGSTNGTFVNSALLEKRHRLRDGDIVVVGNFRVEFQAGAARPDPVAQKETNAMSLDALGLPGTTGALRASLKTLSGAETGREVPLVKAVTTFGQRGVAVVSISHRRDGYYLAAVDGIRPAALNGQPLGTEASLLEHHDVINLAGVELEFLLVGR